GRGPPVIQFPAAEMAGKPQKSRTSKASGRASGKPLEVHKFGGAPLADAGSYRHAVEIIRGRSAPCVVVVSAPAGVTDALLGLARRAATGEHNVGDIER